MANNKRKRTKQPSLKEQGITGITVAGFKSITKEQSIEIRPLTILAGANSTGKSSMIQPLLLLKQTLSETFDPGAILLSGPNIKFSSIHQLLSYKIGSTRSKSFTIGCKLATGNSLKTEYSYSSDKGIEIKKMTHIEDKSKNTFYSGMQHAAILKILPDSLKRLQSEIEKSIKHKLTWSVTPIRCFFAWKLSGKKKTIPPFPANFSPAGMFEEFIREIIHLPGLRGNPERVSPVTAVGPRYPGTFEKYVASVITDWQESRNREKLYALTKDLEDLGLTWKITAKQIDDTRVELRVGRLVHPLRGGARDLVNIADVGFGLSQILPVLVALHVAKRNQLVYLEQPEIHLHPAAQYKLANVIAKAAKREVRVVVETHSALLLLGIQTLIAKNELPQSKVILHWFERNKDGETQIRCSDLDERGAFGDWPEDFSEVELKADSAYLDAAGLKQGSR